MGDRGTGGQGRLVEADAGTDWVAAAGRRQGTSGCTCLPSQVRRELVQKGFRPAGRESRTDQARRGGQGQGEGQGQGQVGPKAVERWLPSSRGKRSQCASRALEGWKILS